MSIAYGQDIKKPVDQKITEAREKFNAGKHDEALVEFSEVIADRDATAIQVRDAKRGAGLIHRAKNSASDEALALFLDIAQDLNAEPAEVASARFLAGSVLRVKRDHEGAENMLSSVIDGEFPAETKQGAATELGHSLMTQGKFAEAEAKYRQAATEFSSVSVLSQYNAEAHIGHALRRQGKIGEANQSFMAALLGLGRINKWEFRHQYVFDHITIRAEDEAAYREFCGKLNFLILPVEANIEIKTMLRRIAEGQ